MSKKRPDDALPSAAELPTVPPKASKPPLPAGEAATVDHDPQPTPAPQAVDAETVPPSATSPSSAPTPRPGLPGYAILGELGRGGMGVVYKARQLKLDRLVALKMILSGSHSGAADLERFRVEAQAIARLQHPHIVQVHEVGEHDGLPYFSLEYCAGGTLAQKLAGTPLPPKEAAALVETLRAARQKDILHRDLKPANVLLSEDGTPKITDFGLAKKLDEVGKTATGAVMGTPSYMAPEQAGVKSGAMGPACDVYALGAILYECLTGRPPFKAATPLDTIMQVVSEEPVPVRQLNGSVPADLETICLKCLHKQTARRYPTAEALADELRRFRAGEPIQARPVGRLERLSKWMRRKPAQAAALAVSMVAALTLLIGGLWFTNELRNERDYAQKQETDAKLARAKEKQRAEELTIALGDVKLARDAEKKRAGELTIALGDVKLARDAEKKRAGELDIALKLATTAEQEEKKRSAELKEQRDETKKALEQAKKELFRFESMHYIDHIAGADKAIQEYDMVTARLRLDACGWDLRHVEHSYLRKRFADKCRELPGHGISLALSSDGKRLYSVNLDSRIQVWDAEAGKKIGTLNGHEGFLVSLALSSDGKRLFAGTRDGEIDVWDVEAGKKTRTLGGHRDRVFSVALSSDGERLFSGSHDGTIQEWDLGAGIPIIDAGKGKPQNPE